jgi:hypothetical protein
MRAYNDAYRIYPNYLKKSKQFLVRYNGTQIRIYFTDLNATYMFYGENSSDKKMLSLITIKETKDLFGKCPDLRKN